MENEGDLLELLELDVPQLGCIDDLMNNMSIDNNENQMMIAVHHDNNPIINDHEVPLSNIDTRKLSGEVLDQLGFDQPVEETNNEGFDQLGFDQLGLEMINNDVGPVDAAISIPADAIVSDTIFAPRKKQSRWTNQEHRQFRKAIVKGLWGKWKQVSKLYIPSKTPSQITSHAQKYANRKNNTHKKRKSINDDDDHDHTHDQPITVLPPTRSDGSHDHVNHHQHVHIHDPSSSSSSNLSMVDYQMMSPLQVQSQSTTPTPPPTSNHMYGNGMMMMNYDMPPPAAYDNAAAIYYANKCLHLEKQILNLRRDMMMTMQPINAQLFPGAGYSTSNASTFGVINQPLQPYVVSSSSHVHHDAYFKAPLDHQGLQPQPLVQQITQHHHHQGGDPLNHAYY